MPTPSESASFSSVLDHYGGFAPTRLPSTPGLDQDRIAYLRRNSERSLHSNASGSRPSHSRANSHTVDNTFPLSSPIDTPSHKSSSSSLRHTVDMLKAGVFPPGLRRVRSGIDSSSDGSHYDDDDESEEHGFRVESGDPFGSAHSQLHQTELDVFTNALDSPDVPLRRSSQHSSLQAKGGSNPNSPDKQDLVKNISEEKLGSPTLDAASPATIMIEPHSPGLSTKSTPPKKSNNNKGMTRTLTDDVAPMSTQKELDLEKALAGEKDPNRPKTLKEARAFAKERARLRLQAKEVGDLSSSAILDSMPIQPTQSEKSIHPSTSIDIAAPREDSSTARSPESSSEWRGHSRQLETTITSRGEDEDQRRETIRAASPEKSNALAMEDLQSAVGEALQDMSFSPSSATDDTIGDLESSAILPEASSTMKLEIPTSRGDIEDESGAMSVTSFTSAQDFVFAIDAMPKSRKSSFLQSIGHDTDYGSAQGEITSSPLEPANTTVPPLTPNTITDVQRSPDVPSATFIPHKLHTQQRSTAPNKIARLDIYGKTVPWPPAFHPAAIIEQRRLAPWERARSYAHYCNDLTSISTGLDIWVEMVQRPVHRLAAEPATPVKKHLRGEATDHSGYAASVRSDATFPMRGDGGRAKELVSHIPAVINESPPNLLPNNIPYPMLVQQAGRSSSSSFDDYASPTTDRSLGSKAGFFTNLGRKSSTRRTPGSGSLSSFTALSSSASSNTIRPRGKASKTISSPMGMSSSPSIATIKSGLVSHEASSSPSAQSTRYTQPSSPLVSTPASRTPMGPRAPAGLTLPEAPVARRGSAASAGSYEKSASNSDWSASAISPTTAAAPKSSLSYTSVRDNAKRSPILQQAPSIQVPQFFKSSDSSHSHGKSTTSSRRSSHQMAPPTTAENEAVDKLSDVLPDAERSVLLEHLRKAGNNDLLAIGSYLQENALSEGKVFLR